MNPALLIILIGFNATAIETNTMEQCLEVEEYANKEFSKVLKPNEYAAKCFNKIGGASRGS
jgi:hypothetical protein